MIDSRKNNKFKHKKEFLIIDREEKEKKKDFVACLSVARLNKVVRKSCDKEFIEISLKIKSDKTGKLIR